MTVKLIHIGHSFYQRSGNAMSSLYTEDGYGYDWGFVQRDLEDGKRVEIRPASPIELIHYERLLEEWTSHRHWGRNSRGER